MFKISRETFQSLIDPKSPEELKALGGVDGICDSLKTNKETGLNEAEQNNPQRVEQYGNNTIPKQKATTIFELVWEALEDNTLRLLSAAAFVSLVLGIHENPSSGWIEGTAILFAVLIVVFVTAINDYQKEIQFRKLNDKKDAKDVKVIRNGVQQQIPVHQVLVGDVVEIATGDILSADGIFISGHGIKCDESGATGEPDSIKKGYNDGEDPFFLSGTQVMEGSGKMVVVAVGVHSFNGKTLMGLRTVNEDTPLQVKLEALAESIAYVGIVMAGLTFSVLIVKHVLFSYWAGEDFFNAHFLSAVVKYIITAITMLVVAVPEGLPLAVTMALAFSTMKMLEDNNLVRHLDACETMGGATNICSDKTGTLTENRMTVVQAVLGEQIFDKIDNSVKSRLPADSWTLIFENIASNSDAYEITKDNGVKQFVGSKTECALLQFSTKLGQDYKSTRKALKIGRVYPFSSSLKRMSTIVDLGNGKHRLFVKGASEIVVSKCQTILVQDGSVAPLDATRRERVLHGIDHLASEALRTIGLAYADLENWKNNEGDGDTEGPDVPLTLLGVVGIEDPVRGTVPKAVKDCQRAGITVRMVTGDNLTTAKNIAKKCGIYTGGLCMEGPAFRKLQGQELQKAALGLQVLARSSPLDKKILVETLKGLGEVVAVTGDGTNDGPALKLANVGFSMGITGTEVAKEASDIVLMDDNFASIVKAVSWGRNVYDSIRKFLQFQMTVNVAAVALAFIGSVTDSHGESPLKPVQLLWVNLIMDTMAALALATDSPTPELLTRKPYSKTESLITPMMWRNIIGQAVFQLVVNLSILYYGDVFFGVASHSVKHLTYFFNIFVFCQVFNEINARKIHGEKDIFSGLFANKLFVSVLVFTIIMQFLFVEFGGSFVGTCALSLSEWFVCIAIGALSIPVAYLLHFIPLPKSKRANTQLLKKPTLKNFAALASQSKSKLRWSKAINEVKTQSSIVSFIRRAKRPTNTSTSFSHKTD